MTLFLSVLADSEFGLLEKAAALLQTSYLNALA